MSRLLPGFFCPDLQLLLALCIVGDYDTSTVKQRISGKIMKAIQIVEANADAIKAALHAVNGRSVGHAYTEYSEVADIAAAAEKRLAELLPNLKAYKGARWAEVSGAPVANAYRYMRDATAVTIERKSSGWYLVDVRSVRVGKAGGGAGRLFLTEAQDVLAKEKLAKAYGVMRGAA